VNVLGLMMFGLHFLDIVMRVKVVNSEIWKNLSVRVRSAKDWPIEQAIGNPFRLWSLLERVH
jgi:hypothetical protein